MVIAEVGGGYGGGEPRPSYSAPAALSSPNRGAVALRGRAVGSREEVSEVGTARRYASKQAEAPRPYQRLRRRPVQHVILQNPRL